MKTPDKIILSVFLIAVGCFCSWASAQCSEGSGLRWAFGLVGAAGCVTAIWLIAGMWTSAQRRRLRAKLDALPCFEMLVDGAAVPVSGESLRALAQAGEHARPVRVEGRDEWKPLLDYRPRLHLPRADAQSKQAPAHASCAQTGVAVCMLLGGAFVILLGIAGSAVPIVGVIGTGVMLIGFFICLIGALLLR